VNYDLCSTLYITQLNAAYVLAYWVTRHLVSADGDRIGLSHGCTVNVLQVADFKAPVLEASGQMLQGMYAPKPVVWEELYDPIHILLRAVHRRDFQTSLDRFTE
jgi:hypothetical protein